MGTITKALELLNFFSRARPEIGLGEFVRLSERDKATVHRHLVELEANGFLEQHPETRAYRLGPAILRLSLVRETTHPVRGLLRPIINALANEVGELAHASLLQGEMLSPIYHFDPALHGTQVHFDAAEMLPLHATSSGAAVLAFGPPDLLTTILSAPLDPITRATTVDPDDLRRIVDAVRESGIAYNDRGFDEEVTSLAAPIFGAEKEAIGAISVAVPTVRVTPDRLRIIADALHPAARAASHSLGGTHPAFRTEPVLPDAIK